MGRRNNPSSISLSCKLTYRCIMAALLTSNNVEEEFLWSCTLSATEKEYKWDPSELGGEEYGKDGEKDEVKDSEGPKKVVSRVKPGHRLLVKSAILMPTAKKDDVTVVQIESEGFNKQKVEVPMVAMKGGVDLQKYVDLFVPGPAKLKIVHGEGPIHLVGSHCVDYFGFKDEDVDSEEEDEGDTENEMDTAEEEMSAEKDDKKVL